MPCKSRARSLGAEREALQGNHHYPDGPLAIIQDPQGAAPGLWEFAK